VAELRPLLIATSNAGKLREVRAILQGLPVILESLDDHSPHPEPVEDGATFEENAERKAVHYARLTGCWTLADDSGLIVDALGGAPGVHSARYAGQHGNSAANNAKLVKALRGVPDSQRTARFYCAAALADPTRILCTTSGIWEGRIVDQAAGDHGFGYDPHFFVPDQGVTSAQMAPELKNRLSHRFRALARMRQECQALLAV